MGRMTWRVMDFREYEGDAFAEYLEEMAAKGWVLRSIDRGIFRFQKEAPRRAFYLAVPRPGSSEMDNVDCEEARLFREKYEQMGWKLHYGGTMWQIFTSEQPMEETLPKEDPETWLQDIKRTMFSFGRVGAVALLVLLILMNVRTSFRDPVQALASYRTLFSSVLFAVICLTVPIQYLFRLIWYRKAVRQVRETGQVPKSDLSAVKRRSRWYACFWAALVVLLFVSVGLNGGQIAVAAFNAVVLVAICSFVLYWIQHNSSGSRRDNAITYTVGTVCVGGIVIMLLTGVTMRFFSVEEEPETYQRKVELPVEWEALGYTFGSGAQSDRSFLAAYQREFGKAANGWQLCMTYYQCRISPVLDASRRRFPDYRGDAWEMTETEYPQEDGVRMVRYHYELADPDLAYSSAKSWDLYVVEDRERFLVLDYSGGAEPETVFPALEAFRSTGSGKQAVWTDVSVSCAD